MRENTSGGTVLLFLVLVGGIIAAVVYFATLDSDDDDGSGKPAIKTKLGTITGRLVEAPGGGKVEEFLGIPFAQPPVGDLRYANPVAISQLPSEPFEATEYGHSCIQFLDETFGDFEGTDMWNPKNERKEDCLYLNVWVPDTDTKKKAVAVWIYGGGFFYGGTSLYMYDGKTLAAQTDMIVVSIGYRLGSMGFLSTGDGKIKGNFGMMDQVLALQWVNDNIKSFGGSTEGITIFGESAGAANVVYLALSPLSRDLFSRVWIESGSAHAHWAYMSPAQAEKRSDALLANLNCTNDSDVLKCLRALDAETILWNEWVTPEFVVPWGPTVDGEFVDEDPYTLIHAGGLNSKDVVVGTNQNEGTYWIVISVPGLSKDGPSPLNRTQFLDGVDIMNWDYSPADRQRIIDLYTPADPEDGEANTEALDSVSGDRSFTCPTKEVGKVFAEQGMKTYYYYLTYRASNEVWPEWMGVIHLAEIQYIFGMPLNKSRGYTDDEVEFSKTIMTYLANFVKTGDPNGKDVPEWPLYNDGKLLEWASASAFTPADDFVKVEKCELWDELNEKYFKEMI